MVAPPWTDDKGGEGESGSTSGARHEELFPGQGGSAAPQRESRGVEPVFRLTLPKTVAEVEARSTRHTDFASIGLPPGAKFTQWCLLVPHPYATGAATDPTPAETSSYLAQHREALGSALPRWILLVTKVTRTGALDQSASVEIARALGLSWGYFPILIFSRRPEVRIYDRIHTKQQLPLKPDGAEGIVLACGRLPKPAVLYLTEHLPALLQTSGDQLTKRDVQRVLSAAKRHAYGRKAVDLATTHWKKAVMVIGGGWLWF